jgi:Glycosyl transferases group 1/Glycosyltransferase Family 4
MRGGQWQVLYLLQGLQQRGIDCRLLAPAGSPLLAAALAARFDAHALKLFTAARLTSTCDLVHAHDARAHTLGLLARKPLVVSRRVAFPLKRSPFSRYKYARPDRFLAVSQYVQNVLVEAAIPPGKISIVYDGVRLPERIGVEERIRIIALDSDDPGKGKAIVEEASRLAGIPVHFSHALLQDLPEAALFVYITDLEGLGSAALLAMAYGVPVLASHTGGLPEIVEHEGTGMLTSNDPEAVAASMKRLSEDRALALRLGQRGRAAVERRFTVNHMVEDTIRAYERTVAC